MAMPMAKALRSNKEHEACAAHGIIPGSCVGQNMTTPIQDKHHRSAAAEIAGLATTLDLMLLSSALVRAAYEHAQEMSDPWLFNHVVRSWLFAAALAQAQQLKHDAERVAASTLFHDIGLTTAFTGEARFEVFRANAARDFVASRGVDTRGQQIIWDAIALHTTPSIAHFKEVEVACCQRGIGMDYGGASAVEKVLDLHDIRAIVELSAGECGPRTFDNH